jgi:RNA polymerase sigma-70 factor (ECF subfamily)
MNLAQESVAEIDLLYREHGPALLLFALAITGERSKAQDAVHHVFLRLLEKGDLRRASDKKAYLFGCVRNAILNERKRQDRQRPLDDSAWFSPPDQDYAGEQNLRRALAALPEDQRQVVVLHVWGELTFSQVGDLLNVNANTAASRYRYALGKLRDLMLPRENSCAGSR